MEETDQTFWRDRSDNFLNLTFLWEGIIVPLYRQPSKLKSTYPGHHRLPNFTYTRCAGVEEVSLVYPGTRVYTGQGRWARVEEGAVVEEVTPAPSSTPAHLPQPG